MLWASLTVNVYVIYGLLSAALVCSAVDSCVRDQEGLVVIVFVVWHKNRSHGVVQPGNSKCNGC